MFLIKKLQNDLGINKSLATSIICQLEGTQKADILVCKDKIPNNIMKKLLAGSYQTAGFSIKLTTEPNKFGYMTLVMEKLKKTIH